ncbi:MAG: hypothetical protein EBS62_07585 [Betaproteobacteria bacterium]|nr:hypothetical protein [Betaproteobacteria bacterium]
MAAHLCRRGACSKLDVTLPARRRLQAQANGAYSIKATVEFQCEEAQWRTVERSYYERPMAEGESQLREAGDGEWQSVAPETVAAFTLLAVCSP